MKKTIAIVLVALMALTMLAACAKKDALIGTWAHEETQSGMTAKMTMEFTKDGKLIIKGYMGDAEMMSEEKTYKVEGDKIIVDGDAQTFKISGKTLTLGEGEDALVFTKQ